MASTPSFSCSGAVGLIDWLGRAGSAPSIPTEKQFRNASERYRSDDCSEANPLPPGWSKRQKTETITQGSKSAQDEKWSCEEAVNATATGGVNQARDAHERERCRPQNRFQIRRRARPDCEGNPRCTPEKPRAWPLAQEVALRTPRIRIASAHF